MMETLVNLTSSSASFFNNNITMNEVEEVEGEYEHLTAFERNFYLLNGLVGTGLNLLVLLITFLHVDTNDKPRQIIVANMTAADLLTCTLYMLTRSYLSFFPPSLCYPYYVSIVTPQLCSCFNLLWINVDKFLFIKRPLHYYQLVTRGRLLVLMTLTWSALLALVSALYWFMNVKHACDQVELSARIYLLICSLYIAVISASFAVSVVIFFIVQRARRRAASSKEAKRLFKRLFFVFSSTLWTFCTCLPYRLLYLYILLSAHPPGLLLRAATDFFYMLLVLGIVINSLVTIITQRLYRQWMGNYARRLYARRLFHLLQLHASAAKVDSPAGGGTTKFSSTGLSLSAKRRSMQQLGEGGGSHLLEPLTGELLTRKWRRPNDRLESVAELEEERENNNHKNNNSEDGMTMEPKR